jgi:hypothetical protein
VIHKTGGLCGFPVFFVRCILFYFCSGPLRNNRGSIAVIRTYMKALMCCGLAMSMGVFFQPVIAVADSPDEAATIYITTMQTQNENKGIKPAPMSWRLTRRQIDASTTRILFYPDAAETEIGDLLIDSKGRVEASPVFAQQNAFQGEGIFLLSGFSAPCTILPVDKLMADCPSRQTKTLEANIMGQRFARDVEFSCDPVDADECLRQGWIRQGENHSGQLNMISAVDPENGRLLVRQLWRTGDVWWLYEETEHHRSWRMNEGIVK